MELKFEVLPLPVTDVDRAKQFYGTTLGFHVDVDHRAGESFRVVQFTPPGSAASIMVGVGIVDTAPGSVQVQGVVVRPDYARRGRDQETSVVAERPADSLDPRTPVPTAPNGFRSNRWGTGT